MTAVSETDVLLLHECAAEWQALREHPLNVLVEGPVAATEAAIDLLIEMHPDVTIVWNGSENGDHLSSSHTLVVKNAGALCVADQERLLDSLGSTRCPSRVITTSEQPLFARVEAGLFDPTLYYRLNTVLLRTCDVAPDAAIDRLQTFLGEVKASSPDMKVIVPKYFEPIVIP